MNGERTWRNNLQIEFYVQRRDRPTVNHRTAEDYTQGHSSGHQCLYKNEERTGLGTIGAVLFATPALSSTKDGC